MDGQSQIVVIRRLPKRNGYYPVVVEGELDIYSSPRLRDELAAILDGKDSDFGPGDRIVIHTESGEFVSEDGKTFSSAGLEYIDAGGLGVMVSAMKRARKKEGTVCLVIAEPRIRRPFEVTGLDKFFEIYASADELR
jgi:anti-sigma B factor antagonist